MFDDEENNNDVEAGDASGNYQEDDRVIVDKGFLSEETGIIRYFYGDGYCVVLTDGGDEIPVHVFRLSKNS